MQQNLTLGTRFKATGYYAWSNGIFGPSHAECPPQDRGTWDDMRFIGWGYMDAVGVTRNRSPAILSWTGQEAHEARCRVANEARAVYLLGKCVAPMFVVSLVLFDPRQQIAHLLIVSRGFYLPC